MSKLGEVFELLHGASRSFRTVRPEVREWRHHHRLHDLALSLVPAPTEPPALLE